MMKQLINVYAEPEISVIDICTERGFADSPETYGFGTRNLVNKEYEDAWE